MRILGVTLSEFHDKAGFQLVVNIPQGSALTHEQFKLYSDLILPREELCDRILAIEFKEDYFLVVNPLLSQNKEFDKTYKREKYIYSLSILVDKSDYLEKVKQPLYKQLVSKIAKFVKIIEQSNHIIYDHPKYTEYISTLLQYYFSEVNQKGSCDLTFLCGNYTFINANHPPHMQNSIDINCASVPVTNLSEREINKIESELGRQLLEYAYHGTYSFRKICRMHRDKKQSQLKAFYIKGIQKGVVFMLDMINLNNCYALTKEIQCYLPDQPHHSRLKDIAQTANLKPEQEIDIQQLLCLYFQFNRVSPISKIIEANRKLVARVDLYKLIRMGQMYGFLKRLQQKITYTQLPSPLILIEPLKRWLQEKEKGYGEVTDKLIREEMNKMSDAIKDYLSSSMTLDEIMVNLQIDQDRLLKLLSPINRFVLQINP